MTENTELMTESAENTELMTINREDLAPVNLLDMLNNPENSFLCSIEDDGSRASKVKIFNAINQKGESLDDHKGEVLKIVNIAAHPVTLTDENTGELVDALRIIMIDEQGKNYDAVSQGIASSLQKIIAIVGPAPWKPALSLKIVEQKTRKGFKTNTIELV